jgi:hypothetical protein
LRITNQKRVYKGKRNTSFILKEIIFQARFLLVAQLFFAKIIIDNVRFFIIGAIYSFGILDAEHFEEHSKDFNFSHNLFASVFIAVYKKTTKTLIVINLD